MDRRSILITTLVPSIFIIFAGIILADAYHLMNTMDITNSLEFTYNSNFWHYELYYWYEKIQPTALVLISWYVAPILSGIILTTYSNRRADDHQFTQNYKVMVLLQLLLLLVYMELVVFAYAQLTSTYLPNRSLISVMYRMQLYYVLPMLAFWYILTELATPRIKLSQNQAYTLLAVLIPILFYSYLFTAVTGFED